MAQGPVGHTGSPEEMGARKLDFTRRFLVTPSLVCGSVTAVPGAGKKCRLWDPT